MRTIMSLIPDIVPAFEKAVPSIMAAVIIFCLACIVMIVSARDAVLTICEAGAMRAAGSSCPTEEQLSDEWFRKNSIYAILGDGKAVERSRRKLDAVLRRFDAPPRKGPIHRK